MLLYFYTIQLQLYYSAFGNAVAAISDGIPDNKIRDR